MSNHIYGTDLMQQYSHASVSTYTHEFEHIRTHLSLSASTYVRALASLSTECERDIRLKCTPD